MTYQEKRTILNMVSGVLILFFYGLYVYTHYPDEILRTDDYSFWGKAFLIMIPISVVARIVIHIFFVIFMKVTTNEEDPPSDERDKLIELKSSRIGHFVFGMGFMLAMAAITFHYPIQSMFIIMILSGLASELTDGIAQLIYYRRGF